VKKSGIGAFSGSESGKKINFGNFFKFILAITEKV
jgi:hypothetical protein